MTIIAQAATHAAPCCPSCGSARDVSWSGREGGTGASKDVWTCSKDNKTFKTTAR